METNLTLGPSARKYSRPPHRGGPAGAIRVLGVCGLLSAVFSAAAGFLEIPVLLGIAGATMLIGNVYAIVGARRDGRGRR